MLQFVPGPIRQPCSCVNRCSLLYVSTSNPMYFVLSYVSFRAQPLPIRVLATCSVSERGCHNNLNTCQPDLHQKSKTAAFFPIIPYLSSLPHIYTPKDHLAIMQCSFRSSSCKLRHNTIAGAHIFSFQAILVFPWSLLHPILPNPLSWFRIPSKDCAL